MMETKDLKEIGKSLANAGRFKDAIVVFEKVRAREPDDIHALDMLGFLYYMADEPARALEHCERSVELDPDNYYAHKGLGLCLVRVDRVDEGLAALERSIELNPEYFDAHHDLGVTYLELERYDEARACFVKAREIDPARGDAVDRALARIDAALQAD
jgi:tetratricopeptide (TPR) repeat protein